MSRRFVSAMAARELRGSGRRLLLYGACMALGIAALVALSGLRTAIGEAVSQRARSLMGADLMLRARTPFSEPILAEIASLTGGDPSAVAEVTSFASMALAERSGRTRLVHVQAVEAGFPFYGEIVTEPADRWPQLQTEAIAIVDPAVLIQLDIEVGETLKVGHASFLVAAAVTRAPGTFGLRASVAPRVFIPAAKLSETGLVQLGSMIEYLSYLRVPRDLEAWADEKRPLLEAERTTARTVGRYQEDLSTSFAMLTRYLGLVGLTALLLGGVGVAAGIRVFVQEKLDTAATLRALGARSSQVIGVYLVQAALLGGAGALFGVALGMGVQAVLPRVLAGLIPVSLGFRPDPWVALMGVVLGVGVALLFAAVPLLELRRVTPMRALRRDVDPDFGATPHPALLGGIAAAILAATLWQAPGVRTGLAFAAALAAALGVLALAARGLTKLLRERIPSAAPYWLRQGVANLFRPRNQTLPATLTVGFGLFLVASVQLLQGNLLAGLVADERPDRPNLVLFDVQRDQRADVASLLEERGTRIDDRAPMVAARIAAIRGERAEDVRAGRAEAEAENEEERGVRWALRREYRLTYHKDLRDTERLTDGRWWGDEPLGEGPVPVSFEEELAETLGLAVGDGVTWNIQGVEVESVITSLREVDWGRFSTNFFVVFPPGVLEDAPQSLVILGHLAGEDTRAELQRDVVGQFPNVSIVDASTLLRAVDTIVGQVSLAVRFMALFTLLTGLVVLVAAAGTSRFQRVREALLLRTLGARARTVRRILTTESFVLGALAATVGLGLAVLATWALVRFFFEQAFHVPVADLLALWIATVALSTALGFTHAGPALRRPPLVGLREA